MARDIGGLWKIVQSNGDSIISVTHVSQPDGAFAADAIQLGNGVHGGGGGHVTGNFVGFIINWDNNTSGAYNGSFDEHGQIFGATFDLRNPGSTAEWHSDKTF
jgi:hypothetical protein